MARKPMKLLALELALSQLLAVGALSTTNNAHADSVQNELILFGDPDADYPVYMRKDDVTGRYEVIKIFDSQNIASKQYGANQKVFRSNVDELLEDPVIWNMLEEYFPSSEFNDLEETKLVYKKLLFLENESGCGYAADANWALKLFERHEKEFLKRFGFPLYKVVDGKLDFNYEPVMLGAFLYNNIEVHQLKDNIVAWYEKTLNEYRLDKFMAENPPKRLANQDYVNWTEEEWDSYYEYENNRKAKLTELSNIAKNSRSDYSNFGVYFDQAFGYFDGYLHKHGITVHCDIIPGFNNPKEGDIVASGGFTLTQVFEDGSLGESKTYEVRPNGYGDHYMFISEIDENGNIYVSSWGNKYLYDNSTTTWSDLIRFELINKH